MSVSKISRGTSASGTIEADNVNRTVDIPDHDGSTKGLKLGGTLVKSTAAELNILDGVTATAAELNTTDLSAVGAITKVATVALTAGTHGTGSEVNTSLTLPTKCVVLDVLVDVTTAEVTGGTKTIDVGTQTGGSDDPDGFMDAVSVAATGIKRGGVTVTSGLNEDYYSASTRGLLLSSFTAGSDVATDVGTYNEHPALGEGGAIVSITSGSAFTEFAGNLYVLYMEIA